MGHVPVLKNILKCELTKTIYITYRICFPYLKIATNLNDDILCKESGQQAAFKKNPKSVPLPHPSTHFRSFFTYFEIWTKIQHKDKDSYKDNDKEKDAKRITETITVCYTFRILTTQAFQTMSNNEQ